MILFLNSTNRVYNDKELNAVQSILFSDGVFNTKSITQALWKTSGDFLVEASGSDMNITTRAGMCTASILSGGETQRVLIKEEALSASVANNNSYPVRSDAVVIRILQSIITNDQLNTAGTNATSLVVISGNSATPLTDQEISVALGGDPFVRLANISVPLNATEINNSMITDARLLVSMTRAVKIESDSIRLFALENDPSSLTKGQIWYNSTEGILKMFDGINAVALQTQAYDWGYYPPNGLDQSVDFTEAFVENIGGVNETSGSVYQLVDALGSGSYTVMDSQVFKMPNIANPYIRIKMGNPDYTSDIAFKIYTVNGSNIPTTLIETVGATSGDSVPKNDYINLYLDGSLYTPGQNYMIVFLSTQPGVINSSPSLLKQGIVRKSTFTDDTGYLIGVKQSSLNSLTSDALALPWSSPIDTTVQFIMSISEREELIFGQTDVTTNINKLSQSFTAKSKDITGFRILKGADIGVPTDDINISLYEADENDEAIGNILTSSIITEADWLIGGSGTEKEFTLNFDTLVVGKKYVVIIETEDHSDTNNYTLYFGSSANGKAKRWNTADGWVSLDGNIFFYTITSSNRKIVVTGDNGKIPTNLINNEEIVALLGAPIYEQNIHPIQATSVTDGQNVAFGSSQDGNEFYLFHGNSGGAGRLMRYEKDEITGRFIETHSITTTISLPNTDNGAIVKIGIYIYLFTNNNTNIICSRFLASNLSGEQAMTIPTVACTSIVTAWTDGINVYVISSSSNTTSRKWTISGTIMSADSTATIASSVQQVSQSSIWDGESAYLITRTSGTFIITKLNTIDATSVTDTTKIYASSNFSDLVTGGFIVNIDKLRIYIGFEYQWWNEANADAQKGSVIHLVPVSKP